MQIHVIFKTHLDIGFTDYARSVTRRYMQQFIPGALATARRLRDEGYDRRFVWTTGTWLIYEYLEVAAPRERTAMEEAIVGGDIVWHGLPFTTHTELMDASLFRFGLGLSQQLDARFGRKTIAAKMTDVPGHTRAMLPLLAEAGIRFLHLDVNEASHPPDVPPVFVWRHTDGSEVIVMYHASYGGEGAIKGLDHRLYFAHSGDNLGPPAFQEVIAQYLHLEQRFPGATLQASTLDAFAQALLPFKNTLPVVTQEIGDTWIHGAATDPIKVAQYRALSRLRETWLGKGWNDVAFSRSLMLVPEHTWGMDIKVHLDDHAHFLASEVRAQLATPRYKKVAKSWDEQRGYVRAALKTLKQPQRAEAEAALRTLKPRPPNLRGFAQVASNRRFETRHFSLGFDGVSGALTHVLAKASGRNWASPTQPIGLVRYQTFSVDDFETFQRRYNTNYGKPEVMWWAASDYGKPGMARYKPESRFWQPRVTSIWHSVQADAEQFVIKLRTEPEAHDRYGCPEQFTLELTLPNAAPTLTYRLQWFNKPPTRLAEATWFSVSPMTQPQGVWHLDKMGQPIAPLDVVRYGNHTLHAVSQGVTYQDSLGALSIDTLDAPLVAPGQPALLQFNTRQPKLRGGMHFNLHNNVWGTNFAQWFGEDATFRFEIAWIPPTASSNH